MVVGDLAVGKSCLIKNFVRNSFSEDYKPTLQDVYKGTKKVNKRDIYVEIHDVSGDMDFSKAR